MVGIIDRNPNRAAASTPPSRLRRLRDHLLLQEDLNFLLTNRLPRALLTRWMGRFSRIRSPLLTRCSIAIWKLFTDLDLSEAKESRFVSLRDCFTRELRPGSRPIDPAPGILVSPCDGIIGACGPVHDGQVFQAKGFPYKIADLFGNPAAAEPYLDGFYVTLRLTSSMYHRFHAPTNGRMRHVTYIRGDTWNVNPIALQRVQRLFCRNERAALTLETPDGHTLALVAVAAILVASIRLHFLDVLLHLDWTGPNHLPCDVRVDRGQELGWFEHGSTIILFAPRGFKLCTPLATGLTVRMGQPLLRFPQ